MKKLVLLIVAAVAFGSSAIAQVSKPDVSKQEVITDAPRSSWHGYLIDAKSAMGIVKTPDNAMKIAGEYTRESALKEENRSSGYGIVTGGKWVKFDKSGDAKAAEFLKTTKQDKGIMVTIYGWMNGEQLEVDSIKESMPVDTPEVQ